MLWCRGCELHEPCRNQESRDRGRTVYVSRYWGERHRAAIHNESEAFREAYGKHGRIEAKIWELVYHGARRCRYRGNGRSQVQLLVTVAVVNGKRLTRLLAAGASSRGQRREKCTLKAA